MFQYVFPIIVSGTNGKLLIFVYCDPYILLSILISSDTFSFVFLECCK